MLPSTNQTPSESSTRKLYGLFTFFICLFLVLGVLAGFFLVREQLIQVNRPAAKSEHLTERNLVAFIVNQRSDDVSVVDIEAGEVLSRIPVGDNPHEIAYSPRIDTLVTSNFGDDTISLIDVKELSVRTTFKVGLKPHGLAFSATGNKLYVTVEGESAVAVVPIIRNHTLKNYTIPAEIKKIPMPSGAHMLERTADDRYILSTNTSGSLAIIDTLSDTMVGNIITGTGAEGFAIDPSGKTVYVANRGANTLSVVELNTTDPELSKVRKGIETGLLPIRVLAHPTKPLLYVTHLGSNDLWVYNRETMEVIKKQLMTAEPIGMALSKDGSTLYVATIGSNHLYAWDVEGNGILTKIPSIGAGPDGIILFDNT